MSKTYFPDADTKTQNFTKAYPGSTMKTNCCVVHTTEGKNWPGYRGGATAPHLTIKPIISKKDVEIRQHFPADKSARALENRGGGVETNTAGAFQIELIGTCDSRHKNTWPGVGTAGVDYIYWPEAPDWLLKKVAPVFAWIDAEWPDFKLEDGAPRGWVKYPASYGVKAAQRMTFDEWKKCYGIVGHQHVPENSHGDPGNLPIGKLVAFAKGSAPAPEPTPVEPPTPEPAPQPAEATMDARWASINVNGGYKTPGGTWAQRRPRIAAAMLKSKSSLFLLQEAHEEKNEHKQLLAELKKQSHNGWVLVEGDGGNHAIMDGNKYQVLEDELLKLPHARDCIFLNLWDVETGVRSWTWNTHLIAADTAKGRTRAEAADMRTDQMTPIAKRLKTLKRCVGGGDGNDTDYSAGSIRAVCKSVGHEDVRTKVKSVVNGNLNSHDSYKTNPKKGAWIDLLAAGPLVKVLEVGLIDTGDASDHNLIYTRFQITGPVTKFEE